MFSLEYRDIHHIVIGTFFLLFLFIISYFLLAVTLILEHATLLLSSGSSQDSALHRAQSQYINFGLQNAAAQFPAAFQHYQDAEFIRFILKNRLHTFDVNT